jgi:hypothetical protein
MAAFSVGGQSYSLPGSCSATYGAAGLAGAGATAGLAQAVRVV